MSASAQSFVDSHRGGGAEELFGIAEIAAEFGISTRTIRFYESGPRPSAHHWRRSSSIWTYTARMARVGRDS
jgi:hypothetical protein